MRGPSRAGSLDGQPAQLRRLEWNGAPVLAQDPAGEQVDRGVLRREDITLDVVARAAVGAGDPPRGVGCNLDLCLGDDVAELPLGPSPVQLDVEFRR